MQFSYFSLCDVLLERLALLGFIALLEVYPAALCIFFIALKIKKYFPELTLCKLYLRNTFNVPHMTKSVIPQAFANI